MRSPGPIAVVWLLLAFVSAPAAFVQAKPSPPPSAPYKRQSLAELGDEALLVRMGRGRQAYEFERASIIESHLPADFWTLTPSRAALALLEANRSTQHRARFRLEVDDRRPLRFPKAGSVAVSYSSSRCYSAVDSFYFLRFDPEGSYLAYASLSAGGVVFYNVVHDQPEFDLRICPLPYDDAYHLAVTIRSLESVQCRDSQQDSLGGLRMMYSTADGQGSVTLRDEAGNVLLERSGTRWSAQLSERWSRDLDNDVFVNFASYLITRALPERLGKQWTDAAPSDSQVANFRFDREPRYTAEDLAQIKRVALRLLADFSPDQERVSFAIVAGAANAAGTLVVPESRQSLERILAALPQPKSIRSFDEVSEELRTARQSVLDKPERRAELQKKVDALEAEQADVLRESGYDTARYLRAVVDSSLRKLSIADDAAALQALAVVKSRDGQWALQRLSRVDPARYVQALETCMRQVDPQWARQFFDEIVRVDPARATEIAAALPPDKVDALTVSAAALFHKVGRIKDEAERVAVLLEVLHDAKSGWQQRGEAIDLLVPPEDPMRYPQRQIDDALLRVMEADQADDTINFTQGAACRALALRGRTETFDHIAGVLAANRDPYMYGRILAALAHLAQADPKGLNPRLVAIIKPELSSTNKQMTDILWAIWTADLRGFAPRLEKLGTSGPEDYEDAKASSYGGNVTKVTGRFHLARKISDTWNATDPVTEIRLLTGLALEMAHDLTTEPDMSRLFRLKASLRQAGAKLTEPQRERLEAFFKAVMNQPERDNTPGRAQRLKIVDLVREAIAPQEAG